MGVIKQEDVVGYRFDNGSSDGEIVCLDCVQEEELKKLAQDEIIEQSEIEKADGDKCISVTVAKRE